jgi:hypothetical protein
VRKSLYCNGGFNIFQKDHSCPKGYTAQTSFLKDDKKYFIQIGQCGGVGNLELNRGVYFGGIYSKLNNNPLTSAKKCPNLFDAYSLYCSNTDYICLSLNEEAKNNAVSFGGIFSICSPAGNLFANSSYSCPYGYKKEFITSLFDCDIYYCTDGNLDFNKKIELKRPPFISEPEISTRTSTVQTNGGLENFAKSVHEKPFWRVLFYLLIIKLILDVAF